jgi:hypothetical protein
MAQTKQTTMNVDGEKIVLKARRAGDGRGGVLYSVAVNGWKSKVLVRLSELEDVSDMADQALWLALEKGMAKWLDARR